MKRFHTKLLPSATRQPSDK